MEHLENMTPDDAAVAPEKRAKALEKANETFFDWCGENAHLISLALFLLLFLFPWFIPPLLAVFVCVAGCMIVLAAIFNI